MRRVILAPPILFVVMANARESGLPMPPMPPKEPPALAAPVPDERLPGQSIDPRHYSVTLGADINHRADPATGLGYGPGGRYQLDNDRRFMLPGVMLHVPLP